MIVETIIELFRRFYLLVEPAKDSLLAAMGFAFPEWGKPPERIQC
jgi:hypothetical protein